MALDVAWPWLVVAAREDQRGYQASRDSADSVDGQGRDYLKS